MGIIDVKEIKIDYQIPRIKNNMRKRHSFSMDLGWKSLWQSLPLITFNLSDYVLGLAHLSAPVRETAMQYTSNWGVSTQWEATFKVSSINPHQALFLEELTWMTAFPKLDWLWW